MREERDRRRLDVGEDSYLVRYGLMANVGRFHALLELGELERGDVVVIRTLRGMELGEVLTRTGGVHNSRRDGGFRQEPESSDDDLSLETQAAIVRRASAGDMDSARVADESRVARFAECQRILSEADWPGELIDVEPLLDGGTIVLHAIAFDGFDEGVLRARFRVMCDLEVLVELVGSEPAVAEPVANEAAGGSCGSCSSGGCSSGGGCSTGGCTTKGRGVASSKRSGSGCDTCALSRATSRRSESVQASAGASE
jgi:hypothetical protein